MTNIFFRRQGYTKRIRISKVLFWSYQLTIINTIVTELFSFNNNVFPFQVLYVLNMLFIFIIICSWTVLNIRLSKIVEISVWN